MSDRLLGDRRPGTEVHDPVSATLYVDHELLFIDVRLGPATRKRQEAPHGQPGRERDRYGDDDPFDLGGTVVPRDVVRFLERDRGTYTLVFVDPPYAFADREVESILSLVGQRLAPDGRIVLHRRVGGTTPESGILQCTDRRRYGDSEIWILEKEQP